MFFYLHVYVNFPGRFTISSNRHYWITTVSQIITHYNDWYDGKSFGILMWSFSLAVIHIESVSEIADRLGGHVSLKNRYQKYWLKILFYMSSGKDSIKTILAVTVEDMILYKAHLTCTLKLSACRKIHEKETNNAFENPDCKNIT